MQADLAKIYTSTYEVQPGDTLLKISMKYKVASKELINVNNIVNDSIWPNQVLLSLLLFAIRTKLTDSFLLYRF